MPSLPFSQAELAGGARRHAMSPEHVQRSAATAFKAVTEAYETLMDGGLQWSPAIPEHAIPLRGPTWAAQAEQQPAGCTPSCRHKATHAHTGRLSSRPGGCRQQGVLLGRVLHRVQREQLLRIQPIPAQAAF